MGLRTDPFSRVGGRRTPGLQLAGTGYSGPSVGLIYLCNIQIGTYIHMHIHTCVVGALGKSRITESLRDLWQKVRLHLFT